MRERESYDNAAARAEQTVYNKIVEETGASTATISRVNRSFLYGAGGYKKALAAIAEDEE